MAAHARTVAVVGSGIAGLTAAYVANRAGADVTLFEADARLGGHADTHEVAAESAGGSGSTDGLLNIDTGFIVHNRRTYPTLLRLFAELGVATQESDMSMSISCDGCGLEYAGGRGLSGLLPSLQAVRKPRYLWMLTEVRRFHRAARALLDDPSGDEPTLREFLHRHRFSHYLDAHFITPLVSAVWSTAPSASGDYPARYLFTFLANHGMLSVTNSPTWYTVVGGSGRYVERAAKNLSAVHTSSPVRAITREADGVRLRTEGDEDYRFDGVVIATHPDQALKLLPEATPIQREVLGAIGYTVNPTTLHTDTSVLPTARNAQASWNYRIPDCTSTPEAVLLSYNMNRLQALDPALDATYVVSLNSDAVIDPGTVIDRMEYAHPVYTNESVAARGRLPELSDDVVAFAGAYHGWGFHEDGCASGVRAAKALGFDW